MTIEEIWDKLESEIDEEKLEAEVEILGRLLYWPGD